jgi:hypothetical protein
MKPAPDAARILVLGAATMFMAALLFAGLYLRLDDRADGIGNLWLDALAAAGAVAFVARSRPAWRFTAIWALIFLVASR